MICSECNLPKPDTQFRPGRDSTVCFSCRVQSVQFESANPRAIEVRKRDRDFDRDAAAYKRLRKEGIQPRGVDKSAQLEASINHKTEAQLGRSLHKDEIKAFNRELTPIV